MSTRPRAAAVLAALALLLVAGCGGSSTGDAASADGRKVDLAGTVVDPPFTIAPDALVTTEDKPFSLAKDTTAPLTLVFFGYTNCPDICPAVLSSIASGLTKLTAKQQKQVQLYFVTTDPQRDTDQVLAEYVAHFDPSFRALRGDLSTIAKVAKSIGVFVDKGDPLASGGYDPNSHSSYVIGINDQHEAPIFWSGDTAPSQFAADFKFLVTVKPAHLKSANN